MSEFSESFHLYGYGRAATRELLAVLGAPGAIVATNNRCVSFVVRDSGNDEHVISATRGVLARYHYAEAHGLWLRVCRDGDEIGYLQFVWDPIDTDESPTPRPPEMPIGLTEQLLALGVLDGDDVPRLHDLVAEFDWTNPAHRAKVYVELPALFHFAAWKSLSGDVLAAAGVVGLRHVYADAELVG